MAMFILERLVDLISPLECLDCGSEGSILCKWCLPNVIEAIPSRCYKCCAQTNDCLTCKKCRAKTPLKQVWVVAQHSGTAKKLVQELKFGYKRQVAEVIATCLSDHMPYLTPDIVVTHVPTASNRVRQRGFDHAQLIAKQLAQHRELTYQPLLCRFGKTRQVGAKRDIRLKQLQNAFDVANPGKVAKKTVVLVDDVITTGATLETAARLLKRAGAKQVYGAVFSQKL